jgi:PTS system mannose-specific IIA component
MKTQPVPVANNATHNVVKTNMTVSLLLITHDEIGSALLHAVTNTLGNLPIPTQVISIDYKTDPEEMIPRLKQTVQQITHDHSLLILTDLFGSTPSNIAQALQDFNNIRVVAGLNLPMLIRVMNYPQLSLAQLVEKALSGGKDGVCCCEKPKDIH